MFCYIPRFIRKKWTFTTRLRCITFPRDFMQTLPQNSGSKRFIRLSVSYRTFSYKVDGYVSNFQDHFEG